MLILFYHALIVPLLIHASWESCLINHLKSHESRMSSVRSAQCCSTSARIHEPGTFRGRVPLNAYHSELSLTLQISLTGSRVLISAEQLFTEDIKILQGHCYTYILLSVAAEHSCEIEIFHIPFFKPKDI